MLVFNCRKMLEINCRNLLENTCRLHQNGSTYKFSYETGEFVIVKSNGTVITYYIPERGEVYWNEQKYKHGI